MFPTVGRLDQDDTPRDGVTIRHRRLTASRTGRRLSSATPDRWCPWRAAARSRRAPPDWHAKRCPAKSRTASRMAGPGRNRVRRNPRKRQAECLVRGHRCGCAQTTVRGSPNRKRSPSGIQRSPFREAIPEACLHTAGRPEHAGIVLARWRGRTVAGRPKTVSSVRWRSTPRQGVAACRAAGSRRFRRLDRQIARAGRVNPVVD